jgi:LysM domain
MKTWCGSFDTQKNDPHFCKKDATPDPAPTSTLYPRDAMDKLNLPLDTLPATGFAHSKDFSATTKLAGTSFGQVMASASQNPNAPPGASMGTGKPHTHAIASGETLTSIVRQQAANHGISLSPDQSHRLALDLANRNGISDPNRIQVGQHLQLQGLQAELKTLAPVRAEQLPPSVVVDSTRAWMNQRQAGAAPDGIGMSARPNALHSRPPSVANAHSGHNVHATAHPVLKQTLDRAVAKGFIPGHEKKAVHDKILQLSAKHKFDPDDFARLSLMESDGLNPKATNERCHGIIQFCDGPARGAATVGFADKPKAILGLSVFQQLNLVDTYFQQAGVHKQTHNSLDNLYLAVLQPTARQEKRADAPLNILGPQAKVLHEGQDNTQAITRQSIFEGLVKNARQKLSAAFQMSEAPKPAPAPAPAPVSALNPGAVSKALPKSQQLSSLSPLSSPLTQPRASAAAPLAQLAQIDSDSFPQP